MTTHGDMLFHMGGVPVGAPYQSIYGRHWFVDAKTGSDGNSGKRRDRPFLTMDKAFDMIDSGDVIYFRGKVREQLTSPAGVFDITIIGAANQPRHADDHSESSSPGRGSSSATWTTPASGAAAATPLLIVQQQGWRLVNFLMDGPSDAAALQLFRDGGADSAERDASHAHIQGMKFVAAQTHIEFKGGLSQCVLEDNLFFGSTADSILETVGAGIGTNNYHRWLRNHFHNNESHIDLDMNYASVFGNIFGKFTTLALATGGGSNNQVVGNFMSGDYDAGYVAGTSDNWIGNYAEDTASAETEASGETNAVPAA